MCRAPFSIVFLAALFGTSLCASAQKLSSDSMAPSSFVSLNASSTFERLSTDKIARPNTLLATRQNPASSPIIASAYKNADHMALSPVSDPDASQTAQDDPEWRFIIALLGTMAIIGTIAVRRRKFGKPWR